MALRCSIRVMSSCISTFSRPRSSSVQSFSVQGEIWGTGWWETLLPSQEARGQCLSAEVAMDQPHAGSCEDRKEGPTWGG